LNGLTAALAATLFLGPAVAPGHLADVERQTVERACEVVRVFTTTSVRGIPPEMLREAAGVAVLTHVVKAGLVIDRRFGRGVLLVRQHDGRWSHPIFITLEGGGVGLEAGVEATDLVLVFRSQGSVDRILRGKGQFTLGRDATIAAGPLGREIEAPALRRKAEVYAYAHSRGLFAGLSLEGDRLRVDGAGNEAFYAQRGCRPEDVLSRRDRHPGAEPIRAQFDRLSLPSSAIVPVSIPPGPPMPRR
jgi:lipid-binding SYLF domain-containing protein